MVSPRELLSRIPRLPESARRIVPPLVFSAVLGAAAVFGTQRWRANQVRALERERQRLMANYQNPVHVVVAAGDIKEGTKIEPPMLAFAEVPPKFIQPYAVPSPEQVIGLVAIAPIAAGEQVLTNKLRRQDEVPLGQTLSSVTPQGKRAVTIEVNPISAVGGFVRPGDKVDILWNVTWPSPQGGEQPLTLTLFQDVPVLAVGTSMVAAENPQAADNGTVTLALTPQETSLLLFARQHSGIQLSLRPRLENGQVAVAPADLQAIMQKVLGVMPPQQPEAPAPPATREVEVIKGLEKNVVVLPAKQE